jgi:SOS response regulatory protein OraA/RecX
VGITIERGEQSESLLLPISTDAYCELKPQKGEITEEQLLRLQAASRRYLAIRCGENLLSYGPNTAQTLIRKIGRHGFSREEAEAATAHLLSLGLIDEQSDMEREVEKCLRKYWGERRIRAHLWSRGFDPKTLEGLPEILEEIDFPALCATLIRKHYGGIPEDAEGRNRMNAALYRYGFSFAEVRAAARILKDE